MSSQSNEPRESLNRISSYILAEQNIDIGLLTSGHLNERHLWKPPEMRTHQPWETSKVVEPSVQPVPRLALASDSEKLYSLVSPRKQLLKLDQNQKVEVLTSTSRDQQLKLPSIRDSPRPSGQASPRLDFLNCITDKELALKILTGPITSFSKEEKYKNMVKIENEVVKKKDLGISNVLHSTQSNDYLENKLNQELSKLDSSGDVNPNQTLARLSIFSNAFQELIESSSAFRDILRRIKYEYDDYLFYLLKEPDLDPELLNEQLELTEEYRAVSSSKIKNLDMEIEQLEKLIEEHLEKSRALETQIKDEEEFYLEKSERKKELDHYSSRYDNRSMKKQTLGDKIEVIRVQVLQKIQELKLINEKLKTDYLPAVVIFNLKKTIKDIEIETLKIEEQNKYLLTEETEAENELRALLLEHDKTEFASDNVEYLIKFVKNMNVLSLDNTPKSAVSVSDSEFNHKYDDYFS